MKLFELPENWVWTTVGAIYDIVSGGTPSTKVSEYWNGDIPWITSADIHNLKDIRPRRCINFKAIQNSATNLVPDGSLIVVTRVGLGKIALTKTPICFSQDSQALIGDQLLISPDYSLYYLSQAVQIFKYRHRGTTIAGVTKKQLSELGFPLPPLPEQHRIVTKIDELFTKLDAGVESLKNVKAQLRLYRQAVLKHAFKGKLTGEWRERHKDELEPASVLLERIKEERKKNVKGKYKELPPRDTSDLPELPEGWVWAKLRDVCLIQGGYAFKSKDYQENGIPLIRISNIKDEEVTLNEDTVYLDKDFKKKYPDFLLQKEDILIALSGATTGKYGLYNADDAALLNQRVGRLRLYLEDFPRKILFYYLGIIRRNIFKKAYGAAQPNISTPELSQFRIPLPPLAEQYKIVEEIERRFSISDEVEMTADQSLKQAVRLRHSILKKAFEGKLVPQDPNDEPASVLLERIKEDRENREIEAQSKTKTKRKRDLVQKQRRFNDYVK